MLQKLNESKYPPCPSKPKKHSDRTRTVTRVCDDGLELSFNILPNKTIIHKIKKIE